MRPQRDHGALAARRAVAPMYHRNELSVVAFSSGGALLVRPWLRFHIPLIEPGHANFLHPAQDFTTSPTARRAQTD